MGFGIRSAGAAASALLVVACVASVAVTGAAARLQDAGDGALFEKFDHNQDGSLSRAEVGEWPWGRYDRDGDGRVTKGEFTTGREADRRRAEATADAAEAFRLLDWTNDGFLSGTEVRGGTAWAARYDANGDGRITREEFLAGRGKDRPAPAAPAAPAKAARPGGAATPAKWPPFGAYRVGEEVLVRDPGVALWKRATVERYHRDSTGDYYFASGPGVYPSAYFPNYVAGVRREPYWTGYFLGDWDVSMGLAMTTRQTPGRDPVTVYTGGPKQPPLRVNGDGTYSWRSAMNGKLIKGRWRPVPDAPGVVLIKGLDGKDWTLYNNTDGRDKPVEIGIWNPGTLYFGTRPAAKAGR